MNEPTIGYTVHFDVHDAAAFEQKGEEISEIVEETEPETLMYEWFLAEDGGSARLCEWFTDPQGGLDHLTGRALTQNLSELLETAEITKIEVYGTPDEKLAEALQDFPVSGPFDPVTGFTR